jgi:hypothetical protein
MVTIESTPEMAANVYEPTEPNLTIVRRRLGRPLTPRATPSSGSLIP